MAKTLFRGIPINTMPKDRRIDFAKAPAESSKALADRRAPTQHRQPRMFDANGKISV